MATVLITGANKGVGLELTKRYAARGDTVLACCRNPEAAAELIAIGDHVEVFGVQISDGASVAALAETIGERPIDTLINNAGMAGPPPNQQSGTEMDFDGWAETFAVNTMAPLRVLQTFRDNLKSGADAKAVTITSQMGALDLNWPLMYAYSSSKAAVNKVMRMMSAELAGDGISVVLIHPGHVKTDMGGPDAEITPEESGSGIIDVIDNTSLETTGAFMKWNGEPHNW